MHSMNCVLIPLTLHSLISTPEVRGENGKRINQNSQPMSPVPQYLFPYKQNLLKPFGTSRFFDENAIYFSILNYITDLLRNYLTYQISTFDMKKNLIQTHLSFEFRMEFFLIRVPYCRGAVWRKS